MSIPTDSNENLTKLNEHLNMLVVLLGTNMGEKLENLLKSKKEIKELIGKVILESSIYRTAAWGVEDQDEFYNQVIVVETDLSLLDSFISCQQIERQLGRVKNQHWGPRVIDIDILYFNDHIHQSTAISVPHPRISERRFTLVPLNEILPTFIHPILELSNKELLDICRDELLVDKVINEV